jgi:hypothetical protein
MSIVNHVNGREVQKMKLLSFLPYVHEMTSEITMCKFWTELEWQILLRVYSVEILLMMDSGTVRNMHFIK